jgi:hypothetical protein
MVVTLYREEPLACHNHRLGNLYLCDVNRLVGLQHPGSAAQPVEADAGRLHVAESRSAPLTRPARYTRLRTGCSAAWLARRVWVEQVRMSNHDGRWLVTCMFETPGANVLTAG